MQYPLISEYIESVKDAENFATLTNLRPVLDDNGNPVMSSGNFAVVFKMTDGEKNYAVKCFLKEQEGREGAYTQICDYLSCVPSPYLVRTEYLVDELFVDTNQSDEDEFPVLVMDWVEGVSLDRYVKSVCGDEAMRTAIADEFRGLTFWLLSQEFAHGDLKPDNIIVTESGHLVLVDYDGMFVPSMRGQKAREQGTPLYRYKCRSAQDFDEFADDYACVFILLVLMANSVEPVDFDSFISPDAEKILERFSRYYEHATIAPYIAAFLLVASTGRLDRQVLYPLLSHKSTGLNLSQSLIQKSNTSKNLSFTVNGVTFEMVYVEGGTFTMGATAKQGYDVFFDDVRSAHKVTLGNYAIGKFEVTQALWTAVMENNPSNFKVKGDTRPVERVSWNDCQAFIKKLNGLTGKSFRLPTEAEWEYAARGGNKSKGYKYSGSNDVDEVAWYDGNSGVETHPVGTKKPNELGIYDMSGNVWEWCDDRYTPIEPTSVSFHVDRGGSWDVNARRGCRVWDRSWDYSDSKSLGIGFRLALPQ